MELVAYLGKDMQNWGQISALVNRMKDCDKVVIVKDKHVSGFPKNSKCIEVDVNPEKSLTELKKEIMEKVKPKIDSAFEVAVSIASGNGKEHMALISALLTIPVGIRLVVYTKDGIEFIN